MKKEHEGIKPFTKKLILPVSDNNDFFEGADYAIVELSAGMIERIRKLAEAVRSLDVYRISEFNYVCEFRNADYEQWECGKVPLKEYPKPTECNLLNVTDTGFYWSGLYKNTELRWSTDTVLLTTLDDANEFDQREEHPDDEQIAMGV